MPVIIILSGLDDSLIRDIAEMFQYKQTYHETDGLGPAAIVLAIKGSKLLLEHIPVNKICQLEQWMLWGEHCLKIPEK